MYTPLKIYGQVFYHVVALMVFALALGTPARSREPPHPVESVAEAARNAHEHQSNSTKRPKIITNDDLRGQYPVASTPSSPAESSAASVAEVPKPRLQTAIVLTPTA